MFPISTTLSQHIKKLGQNQEFLWPKVTLCKAAMAALWEREAWFSIINEITKVNLLFYVKVF